MPKKLNKKSSKPLHNLKKLINNCKNKKILTTKKLENFAWRTTKLKNGVRTGRKKFPKNHLDL